MRVPPILAALMVLAVPFSQLATADELAPVPPRFTGEKLDGSFWGGAVGSGYAVAVGPGGRLFIRGDGGWEDRRIQDPTLSSTRLWAAAIALDGTLLIAGGREGLNAGPGVILRSTDRGENLSTVAETDAPLTEIRIDPETGSGIAVGMAGTVLLSDDSGQSWRSVDTGVETRFWSGLILSDGTILAAGGDTPWQNNDRSSGQILRSTDGGESWISVFEGDRRISDIEAVSDESGGILLIAAGVRGVMLESRDGGATWVERPRTPLGAIVNAIAFPYPACGLAVGSGGTGYVTRDGGETWDLSVTVTEGSFLEDLAEISEGHYLVTAGDGTVGTIDLKGIC